MRTSSTQEREELIYVDTPSTSISYSCISATCQTSPTSSSLAKLLLDASTPHCKNLSYLMPVKGRRRRHEIADKAAKEAVTLQHTICTSPSPAAARQRIKEQLNAAATAALSSTVRVFKHEK